MWKVNEDGNAYNKATGELVFTAISVIRRERKHGSCTNWLGDFQAVEEAEEFIRNLGDNDVLIKIGVLRKDNGCGGHRYWMGEFASVEDAQTFIKEMVAELNDAEDES